ncbi:general transcription factor II-I repeat domain-containing protein 2B-like [Macrobrachium nipponense]|uniref:general transcription factor II-I repeat domain-containing protein 2B-like n=1 Tax=Macrobrachium nipponense TaxID=159736 RepID=UPI0030C7B08C
MTLATLSIRSMVTSWQSYERNFQKDLVTSRNIHKPMKSASPFSVDVATIPEDIQMEIIELQCNDELRKKFDNSSVYQFYKKHVSVTVYPKLSAHTRKMMAVFGSTYICEQLFSKMNLVKNKYRSVLPDEPLECTLRVATSSIQPDIDELVSQMQHQPSH